ncbi:NAD(P)-dependent oxidoreductase [Microvirga subterranea]|uniref:3-hydroxyisobutyrate dehydrogenase n=1 Tax=Microvirga subterranea TaxID=186651 RepID=A0A370HI17_9HYPH|nr:NAD(P)-dependent oxidoreductase [Microvirga subterranea]RDI56791.1 3-hydroxyisobutyrate dehydrogenase [Microvirga subterranea]
MTNMRDVGVIGLGRMGGGIARRLDAAGRLAGAWDVGESARANAGLSDQVAFAPPAELARVCSAILFVLPGSAEIEECLSGPQGILSMEARGQVLVDLTTSHPEATKRLAAIAAGHGRAYLDAGMTGGAQAADQGRLTLMTGGRAADLDRIGPVLDVVAARVFHLGPTGSGHMMKLVHNMICHTIFLATSEGCRMAERAGIRLSDAVDVLNAGNARSFISEARFPNHIISGTFDGRSPVSNLAKDLAMAVEMQREMSFSGHYALLTERLLSRALAHGMADRDFTTLYRVMETLMAEEAFGASASDIPAPAV